MEDLRIRRLTPKECWRLMGFCPRNKDGVFDDTLFEKAQACNSNSQLYKQAGNSIVVDTLYHVLKNLIPQEYYLWGNKQLRTLELFGGIGACTQALKRLGVNEQLVDYVEIDKYAVKSFNAMNGTDFETQDITEWDKDIEVDLIMHGSPCQDFSLSGLGAGGDEGSGTRSSLMYETIRIVEKLRPKYVVWENVKNLLSKKHKHNFDKYIQRLEELGYTSQYKVLNSADYGIPQKRERVFTVSILGDDSYEFPEPFESFLTLKDECETDVDEKYYVKKNENLTFKGNYIQYDNSGKGHNSQQDRLYFQDSISPTVPASASGDKVKIIFMNREEAKEKLFPKNSGGGLRLKHFLEKDVDEKYYLSDKMIKYISSDGTKNFHNHDCKINLDIARPLTTDHNKRAGTTNYICDELPENIDLKDYLENKEK